MEGSLLGTGWLAGFSGVFGWHAKENVLHFPHSVLRQECGLREHSFYLPAGSLCSLFVECFSSGFLPNWLSSSLGSL